MSRLGIASLVGHAVVFHLGGDRTSLFGRQVVVVVVVEEEVQVMLQWVVLRLLLLAALLQLLDLQLEGASQAQEGHMH